MNIIIKRFLAFFLSFSIIFSTTSALAASPAGWTATAADAVMAGATATITAFKGSGSTAMKAVISHKPTAVAVGKELVKGGGVIALAYAMSKLLDAGIDWVMTEGGDIKYTVPVSGSNSSVTSPYEYLGVNSVAYYSADDACRSFATSSYPHHSSVKFNVNQYACYVTDPSGDVVVNTYVTAGSNPLYNPSAPNEEKYMPIGTVAAAVVANAEAGHAESQDFVKAVAVGAVDAGELDTALDAVAEPTTDTANPDAPTDPTKPFDPSSIIAAIKSVMSAIVDMAGMIGAKFDALIENDNVNAKAEADVAAQEKIDRDAKAKADAEFAEWVQTPPKEEVEDTTIAIPDDTVLPADTDINFGGSCPANFEVNSSIFGNPINIVLLDTAKFCGFLSTFVKYPVYAVSSLFALYILGGRKDV